MLRFIIPFINPLLLLIGFWWFFYSRLGIAWIAGVSLILILFSARILARSYFWKFKLLWLSLIFVYLSQLLFLLILTSGAARYILSFVLSVVWGLVWLLIKRYFENKDDLRFRDYLSVLKFLYYLGFWFLVTSSYALIFFLHLPLLYAIGAILLISFTWAKQILASYSSHQFVHNLLLIFLVIQLFVALYYLPVSFYVMGSVSTLWFFFLMEKIIDKNNFRPYLLAFMLSFAILLATSLI